MAAERSRHLESGVDPGNEVDRFLDLVASNTTQSRHFLLSVIARDQSLVKIFAGSLKIFKDLQRPTQIFKDLQRSYKDPQLQGSLRDPQRFHEDLLKIL